LSHHLHYQKETPMAKKPELSADEKKTFQDAMKGVKPYTYTKRTETPTPPRKSIQKKAAFESLTEKELPLSDHEYLSPLGSEDALSFSRPGIQYKILRKFRMGQYNVEAILDLHRQTTEEARTALSHFIVKCKQKGVRHVLIIHGKGRMNTKPILKNKLNHWLREIDDVLAFCSATPKDGGRGALYVLLRRGS
jgi:DNA-nicking Smr family endonuclease